MASFSKPSPICHSIRVPQVKNLNSKFTYNFYVNDEGTNQSSGVPDSLKIKSAEQINTEVTNIALRLPRYITLSWDPPPISNLEFNQGIQANLDKIVSEVNLLSGKYFPYMFSPKDSISYAYKDINSGSMDMSQATTIDSYVNDLLKNYSESMDQSGLSNLKQKISSIIEQVEKIADNPGETFGVKFYKSDGTQIQNTSGYDKLISIKETLKTQINSLVLPDIFVTSSLKEETVSKINQYYGSSVQNNQNPNFNSDIITPVLVGPEIFNFTTNASAKVSLIGYIIDRFEILGTGPVNDRTFVVENPASTSLVDVLVKYGSTYQYFIRSIVKVVAPQFNIEETKFRNITYFLTSNPITTNQFCEERVPPPPPIDLNFVWDYRRKKLNIVWGMPPNSQRDIKQFQIFRRRSIYEPFELLKQHCFDFSTKKYQTGETIDGNNSSMTQEEASFVEYQKMPTMSFIDEGFTTDIENLVSSKFIYSIASVDAHGFISNYGAQFEVSFDFFKNKLEKKLISTQGAPRPYPNLLIDADLFRDTISVEGSSSSKMKIYFMPEYFKILYSNGIVQKMVATEGQNSYYKMQFINTQNQKTESLKITVDDPYGLVNT